MPATVLRWSFRFVRTPFATIWLLATLQAMLLLTPSRCLAGGGPENVFLLVNSTSADSMTVANHYIALRNIPPTNVCYLPYKGVKSVTNGHVFRTQILSPAMEEMKRRKLTKQIDYLVYSCDFPWRMFFAADFPDFKFPPSYSPNGSLTGMTYLHRFVTEKRKEVVSPNTNWYFMEPMRGITISRAFRSRYHWAAGGRRTGQGLTYMLSSMLGVTNRNSNNVDEIIHSLQQSKASDGTRPKGTVYFMKHGGPRSKPRDKHFPAAAAALRTLGVSAKELNGKFANNKGGVIGLTSGTAYVDWKTDGCRFLPGAYCDNFTSFGALFLPPKNLIDKKTGKRKKQQVSVADFIRHGATIANGTVFEPRAMWQKFPLPSVHVHYANGCSIGEAFYQSVSGPYQQLLVGDPLCQPWAVAPPVRVDGLRRGQVLQGNVILKPTVEESYPGSLRQYELFVDGVSMQSCKPGNELKLDTTKLTDGHHELRIVATDDSPIETQGRKIVEITIKNGREAVSVSTRKKKLSMKDASVSFQVASTKQTAVDLFCNSEKLGSLPKGTGTLSVKTSKLGAGPVVVYAASEGQRSSPLKLEIER